MDPELWSAMVPLRPVATGVTAAVAFSAVTFQGPLVCSYAWRGGGRRDIIGVMGKGTVL